jgi:glutamate-1-semialdehyde 2,1-aminomutase
MVKITNDILFREAKRYIPGGVNSPVRSFKAVGSFPVFMKKGKGPYIYSQAGKKYIDYCLCWGSLILGHAYPELIKILKQTVEKGTSFGTVTKNETELAKLIAELVPSIEQVRLVNSGTEAVMSAVRLARAYSQKSKIIKFKGSYHGHADYLLAKAGSGLASLSLPTSSGVLNDFTKHTLIAEFNNLESVARIAKKYQKDLAAIIVEPVAANSGLILPRAGFLEGLRKIADNYNSVLIFDEVITGFRLSLGGAQEFLGIKPDLTCLGKILGAGLPMGAFGGKKRIMQLLSPLGNVYQAGTLSGNPLSVAAGITVLNKLKAKNIYKDLGQRTKKLTQSLEEKAKEAGLSLKVNNIGSMFSIIFSPKKANQKLFKLFFQSLLRKGIYLSPSGFETNFLSLAHNDTIIKQTQRAANSALKEIKRA